MLNKNKIKILILSFVLFFPLTSFAGTAEISTSCNADADCATGLCAQSNLTGTVTQFCACKTAADCENQYKKDPPEEIWTCEAGVVQSNNVPFCNSNLEGKKNPIGAVTPPPEAAATTSTAELIELTVPEPVINIPGLPKWTTQKVAPGDTTSITYIADYVIAIYKYGLVIGSVLAVAMLMIGGIIYLTAAGAEHLISTAKQIIMGAVSGMILLLGSYLLLTTINPNLVNLNPIEVETIKMEGEIAVQAELGTDSPHQTIADAEPTGPKTPETPGTPVVAGNWRKELTSETLCGKPETGGLTLTTYDARVNKLVPIVKKWKEISVDQGGALYINGGTASCGDNAGTDYIFRTLIEAKKGGLLSPEFLATECGKIIQSFDAKAFSKMKYAERRAVSRAFVKGGDRLAEGQKCGNENKFPRGPWADEYQRIIGNPKKAGMICGDCGSYQVHLYRCFQAEGKTAPANATKFLQSIRNNGNRCSKGNFIFKMPGTEIPKNINTLLNNLSFGDIISWSGPVGSHFFMYTGKKGLEFEILEMGAGGEGDVMGSEKAFVALLQKNSGSKYPVGGVRAHSSAQKYLLSLAKPERGTVCAWRPLNNGLAVPYNTGSLK